MQRIGTSKINEQTRISPHPIQTNPPVEVYKVFIKRFHLLYSIFTRPSSLDDQWTLMLVFTSNAALSFSSCHRFGSAKNTITKIICLAVILFNLIFLLLLNKEGSVGIELSHLYNVYLLRGIQLVEWGICTLSHHLMLCLIFENDVLFCNLFVFPSF